MHIGLIAYIRETSYEYYIKSGEAVRRGDVYGAQLYISISDHLYETFAKACQQE